MDAQKQIMKKQTGFNQKGQTLIEYLLLTALIAVAAMGVMRIMGQSVSAQLAKVTNAIQGRSGENPEMEKIEASDYRKKDMSDFMRGAVSRGQNGGAGGQ